MTTITALPTAPSRADPTNFSTQADAFLNALPTFGTEVNTVAGEINTTASNAATSASNAATSASNSATSASTALAAQNAATALVGASVWVSGTTYAVGDARFSPITFQTYRRKIAGAGTTDPSLDTTNWSPAVGDFTGATWNGNTLAVSKGGTGATTLTGLVKGNGTSAMTAATANTDYLAPNLNDTAVTAAKTITFNAELNKGTSGSSITVTLADAQKQRVTLSANTTITISFTAAATGTYQLRLIQDATGSRTVTWSGLTSTRWGGSVGTPSINSAANGETVVNIFYNGTNAVQTMFKVGAI